MEKIILLSIIISLLFLPACDDDLFAKKQECQRYKAEIEQEFVAMNSDGSSYLSLQEIFYSPVLDTCISHMVDRSIYNRSDMLIDVLTSKFITTFCSVEDSFQQVEEIVTNTVLFYKGETQELPINLYDYTCIVSNYLKPIK